MNEDNINNNTNEPVKLDKYDFSDGVRGKYFKEAHMSSNVIALEAVYDSPSLLTLNTDHYLTYSKSVFYDGAIKSYLWIILFG